jgi:hypothetical protein
MSYLTILALAVFFITAHTSIAKGKEQQSSKDSAPDTSADTELTTPSQESTGMSSSSMEYDPMYPADKPDWIFKNPYWDADNHYFTVIISGDLEASREACFEKRVEGSIDAFSKDLDKYVFKQSRPCNQVPAIMEDLREILQQAPVNGSRSLSDSGKNFKVEGLILEVTTADGPRYQSWRKINIDLEYLNHWKVYYDRADHPERFRNVGFGLLSILGVLGLAHLGVKTIGRKKIGNDTFQTTTYR